MKEKKECMIQNQIKRKMILQLDLLNKPHYTRPIQQAPGVHKTNKLIDNIPQSKGFFFT